MEPKYRAWDKIKKKMGNVESLGLIDFPTVIQFPDGDTNSFFLDGESYVVLMQWTGLKDRNGVEIYEGDILGLPYIKGHNKGEIYKRMVVKNGVYNIGANGYEYDFQVVGFYVEDECMYDEMIDGNLIVMGNIYETPDLLED